MHDQPQSPLETQQSSSLIEYALPSTRSWIRRRRVQIFLSILALAIVGWIAYSQRAQIDFVWWQYRALQSAPAPGITVLQDSQPGSWQHRPEILFQAPWYGRLFQPAATWTPFRPVQWATVFVGKLKTPGGIERLVCVEAAKLSDNMHGNMQIVFRVKALKPATVLSPPSVFQEQYANSQFAGLNEVTEQLVVTAGVKDAKDPSRLTFDYRLGDQKLPFDVWIQDVAATTRTAAQQVNIIIKPGICTPPEGPITREKFWRL